MFDTTRPGGARAVREAPDVVASAPAPRVAPVELAQTVVAAVEALLAGADAVHAPGWAHEERVAVLAALDRVSERVGVYRGKVLAAHRADGRWARRGDRSFEAWRGRTTRQGPGAARSEMQLADGLAALPDAEKAVESGEASLGHARVLTRLRASASERVKRALEDGGAAALLVAATEAGWDVPTLAKRAQAWAAARDVEDVERTFQAVRERRYARVVDRDGGCAVDAFLDPIAGATLRTALEALSPAPSPGDDRTAEQRRADALARLSERVLEIGDDRLGAQIRPHLSLLVPAEAWAGIQRRKHARQQHGGAAAVSAGDGRGGGGLGGGGLGGEGGGMDGGGDAVQGAFDTPVSDASDAPSAAARRHGPTPVPTSTAVPVPMAEMDDGTVVPPSELERLMCDCEITRLVLDTDGIPLDVGQSERTFTKELRRAILARDGHCQWPGCTMRASWCEVHHVRWFSRGGATSLENGLTLCSFHHHQVHRGTAAIEAAESGVTFLRRDGEVLGTSTRSGGARRLQACRSGGDAPVARRIVDVGQSHGRATRRRVPAGPWSGEAP